MGIFRDRLPRDLSEPIDSDIDRAVRVRKAHGRHDLERPEPSSAKGNTSGPSSESANAPKRGRRW
ncbi:hypothetical protein [Streptomyces sp. NBC_00648]|uniref:hypothetical protein n=1 Tax=Streptomyces sp. NBC_00648 TaxID=2975797 RepID=UPI0032435E6F